jgi:hypothetical protein
MADLYPEDITSKAEDEMAGTNTEDAADKEVDGKAEEEEEQEDRAEAEEEQIPQNLHRYWQKSHVKDAHVQALEDVGTMAPQAESGWRTDFKAPVPAPNSSKIVMLKSHVERGLSMPPSSEILWAAAPPYSAKQLGVCSGLCGPMRRIPRNPPQSRPLPALLLRVGQLRR